MDRVAAGRVMLQGLRYRSGQALAVLLLSMLAVAACAFGPLYERSVGQAQLRSTLSSASAYDRGVTVSSTHLGSEPTLALGGGPARALFGSPIASQQLGVEYDAGGHPVKNSLMLTRDAQCAHLPITAGHCPAAPDQVLVSTSAAKTLGWQPGNKITVTVPVSGSRPTLGVVKVVGLYGSYDAGGPYWFRHQYWTADGARESEDPRSLLWTADPLIAGAGFAAPLIGTNTGIDSGVPLVNRVELPLQPERISPDEMATLRSYVAGVTARALVQNDRVDTSLPSLLDVVAAGQRQAGTIIPGFAGELVLLVLVVIGLAVGAAGEARRPDFALARLRGRSRGQAGRLLVAELAPLMVLAALPGLVVAWLLAGWASRRWLAGVGAPELRWPVLAAVAAVLVVQLLIVVVVARRAASQPVHDMLRRVPARVSRLRLGALEAALGAAAAGGVVVVLSGAAHNLLAVLTPGLIALVAGMVLSRLVVAAARRRGQRALWLGRLAIGVAGMQIARRAGARWVVTLLCVAAALIVSASEQSSDAARNRSVRAGAEAGAPVVLSVHAVDAATLRSAVAAGDPSRHYATAVITQRPPNGATVMAVDPPAFARIARWGWDRDIPDATVLAKLSPPRPKPVTLAGSRVELALTQLAVTRVHDPDPVNKPGPVWLLLTLRSSDGSPGSATATGSQVQLGPLPEGTGRSVVLGGPVSCLRGCTLTQMSLVRSTGDEDAVTITAPILALRAGRPGALAPVALGSGRDWARVTPQRTVPLRSGTTSGPQSVTQTIALRSAGGRLVLSATNTGAPAVVQQLSTPLALPTILAGAVQTAPNELGYLEDNNIDALTTSFDQVGRVALIPGANGPALLTSLSLAEQLAGPRLVSSELTVWLASDDPAHEHSLVAALAQHGVTVTSRDTQAAHLRVLDASAPAWAMRLALVSAALAALLAVLVMIMSAAASQRGRAHDLAAWRLVGLRAGPLRRAAILEQTVVASVAVGLGAVVGLVGARLALPSVPIFVTPVPVPAVLHPVAWAPAGQAALACLALLLLTGVAIAQAMRPQVGAEQLRQGQ
ncbi:MAG: hypothetical protein DLM57_15650 [Pseudonocardiales bacterium]|nr:MAG: hypothetical protein DLM57_15650 [Pseudonocardiales bacterium]